jgi:hypothetical protein
MNKILFLGLIVSLNSCIHKHENRSKEIKVYCPSSPAFIDTSTRPEPLSFISLIPPEMTYIIFGYGFEDTATVKIGKHIYENVKLVSEETSDWVPDVEYRLTLKNNETMPFEINTKTCRIRLKTDILSGYRCLQVHYYQDTFRLNYDK